MKLNADNKVIAKKRDIVFEPVIDSNVTEYEILGSIVHGVRVASKRPGARDNLNFQKFGYFVLDMKKNELNEGLGKLSYKKMLDEYREVLESQK